MNLATHFEQADLLGTRIKFERCAFAVKERSAGAVGYRPELHHHGDAARARQHGDVAGRTAPRQRQTAALRPVDFQELRGRQILGADHGAGGYLDSVAGSTLQPADDAIAQIGQIGRAGLQIFIWRGHIVRNLRVEGGRPGRVRRRSGGDRGEHRIEKLLVLHESHLELEDLRRLATGAVGKRADLPGRGAKGAAQRGVLLRGGSRYQRAVQRGADPHERSADKTDRGGSAAVGRPHASRLPVHRSAS